MMYDSLAPPWAPSLGALVISPLRGRTGVRLAGEADCTVRDTLQAVLATLTADGAQAIRVDLTGLEFIDVCCTRELIAVARRHPAARLVVYHPPASLRRITALLDPEAEIEFIGTSPLAAREALGPAGLDPRQQDPSGQGASPRLSPAIPRETPAPDITELILGEHVRIRKLIEELDRALLTDSPAGPGSEPALAWAVLARFLSFHVDAAREISYRALARAVPDAAVAVTHASEADADIRAAIEEARISEPGSPVWCMAVEAASSAARKHIARLESGPLPRYRRCAAPGARHVLGRQWVAFMTARALDA